MSNLPENETGSKAPASNEGCVNLDVNGKSICFTHGEAVTGKTLYFIFVVSVIVVVLGAAWAILDAVMPTGKWDWFLGQLETNLGLAIAIIGSGLFGLFMLFILFYMLYKGGTHTFTKALFSAKKVYSEMKTTGFAKIVTGGIMISVFLVAGGLVIYLIQMLSSGGSSLQSWTEIFTVAGTGRLVLFLGIIAVACTLMVIAFAYLWNAGNIALTRKFFSPKKK